MRSQLSVVCIVLALGMLLGTFLGPRRAVAKPMRHGKTASVRPNSPLSPADKLLAKRLLGQLNRLTGWGQADLTPAQWDEHIVLARQFQKTRPQVAKAVMKQYMRITMKEGPGVPGVDPTGALLLFRVMFVYPEKSSQYIFNFGLIWTGRPLGNSPQPADQSIPAWPVDWIGGRPRVTGVADGVEGMGSKGMPYYDAYDEYLYACHNFPMRDLSKVATSSVHSAVRVSRSQRLSYCSVPADTNPLVLTLDGPTHGSTSRPLPVFTLRITNSGAQSVSFSTYFFDMRLALFDLRGNLLSNFEAYDLPGANERRLGAQDIVTLAPKETRTFSMHLISLKHPLFAGQYTVRAVLIGRPDASWWPSDAVAVIEKRHLNLWAAEKAVSASRSLTVSGVGPHPFSIPTEGYSSLFTLDSGVDEDLSLRLGRTSILLRKSAIDPYALSRLTKFPLEAFEMMLLVEKGHSRRIHGLNDLMGAVHIDSASHALRYVRLRTAPATWYLWPDNIAVVEVIDRAHRKTIPNYGLKMDGVTSGSSGFLGVLSEQACAQEKVLPATVVGTATGYSVTRWLLVKRGCASGDKRYLLEQWQEDVGRTGSYRCYLLRVRPANDGPSVSWQIPTFE